MELLIGHQMLTAQLPFLRHIFDYKVFCVHQRVMCLPQCFRKKLTFHSSYIPLQNRDGVRRLSKRLLSVAKYRVPTEDKLGMSGMKTNDMDSDDFLYNDTNKDDRP